MSRRNGILVVNPLGAVGLTAQKVWILGLAESVFPQTRSDHLLIDLQARQRLLDAGVALPDVRHLQSVEEALFHLVLATADIELSLSYPRRDLHGQVLGPSPFLGHFADVPPAPNLPLASEHEASLQRMCSQHGSVRRLDRAQIEYSRHSCLSAGLHSGFFGTYLSIADGLWHLEDLIEYARCPFRWLMLLSSRTPKSVTVGHLQVHALRAAFQTPEATPDERFALAMTELDQVARCHPLVFPQLTWPMTRHDLQQRLKVALQGETLQRPDAVILAGSQEITTALPVELRSVPLVLHLDRLDDTPDGPLLTLYGMPATHLATGWLAVSLEAAGARLGSWYDLENDRRSRLLLTNSSEARRAKYGLQRHLERIDQQLRRGYAVPTPSYTACRGCTLADVCRASHHRGAA